MPVHLGGFLAACASPDLAESRRLRVIEDAAHAFGSSYGDEPIGAAGDLTCFSFDPIENITCGRAARFSRRTTSSQRHCAGYITSESTETARRAGTPDNPGTGGTVPGLRAHIADINAAIGLAQLDPLSRFARAGASSFGGARPPRGRQGARTAPG